MSKIWFVRAGRESIFADDFLQHGIVAIGWHEIGDFDRSLSKTKLLEIYRRIYPDAPHGQVQVNVSQILRFINEVKIGDDVMTYDREKQIYYLGKITSETLWEPKFIAEHPRVRQVRWEYKVSRSALSVDARNMLGAILTFFLVQDKIATEIHDKSTPIDSSQPQPAIIPNLDPNQILEEHTLRIELTDKAEQAIEDRIFRLDWAQMQELVAGVLRAMGYRTTVSSRGSDQGVDIFASPDGLGLEEPRIFVEVKHRPNTSMGSDDLRKFLGGRSGNDKCLYVSTGGFSKEARYEAARAKVAITLLGLVELRKLLVDYYDRLDEGTKTLVPLKRIYVLAD